MKKITLILSFLLISLLGLSQVTPVEVLRIADATTALGKNLSVGKQVYNVATGELFVVTTGVISTATLTTGSASFSIINGAGVTNLSEGTATETTVDVNSNTGANATLASASATRAGLMSKAKFDEVVVNNAKVTNQATSLSVGTVNSTTVSITSDGGADDVTLPAATTDDAGLFTAAKFDEVVANNAKVSNVSHTGDVSGSTTLTIGADKVLDTHIDWGTSTNQVSSADVPEQTNLYYTEARVDANSAVAANTAKTSNVSTTLAVGTRSATSMGITSDGGTDDVVLPAASTTEAGLMTDAQFDKLDAIGAGAEVNYTFYTESFEEDDGTPTAHTLSHTAQTGGAVVSLNGSVLIPSSYTLASGTITLTIPVYQYDIVSISYNY